MNIEYRLTANGAKYGIVPEYKSVGAGAFDLRYVDIENDPALSSQTIVLERGEQIRVGTGLHIWLGSDNVKIRKPIAKGMVVESFTGPQWSMAGMIIPRSGLGSQGLVVGNSVGFIDSDYQGEIIVCLWNRGQRSFVIPHLDRIAQYVIVPILRPTFHKVSEFKTISERGSGGFGSTGVK